MLVDCAVFSSKGRKLWKTCFSSGSELRESVTFAEFLDCFCRYFTEDGQVPPPIMPSFKCLRQIFCEGEIVTLPHFGRMLGFFGPLEKGVWLEDLMNVMKEPWFWGDTSREIACQKLAAEPRGTFLVRYASEDSFFTISYVALNQVGLSPPFFFFFFSLLRIFCSAKQEGDLSHSRRASLRFYALCNSHNPSRQQNLFVAERGGGCSQGGHVSSCPQALHGWSLCVLFHPEFGR